MYDLTTIKRISKNDKAVISKYIQAFVKSSQEQLQDINEYMGENRWDDIADVLHKMNTSVAYFFMNEIEQKVINTEMNIKDGADRYIIREQIAEINGLLADSFESLQEEINSLSEA